MGRHSCLKSGWTDEQRTELKETVENSDYWWDWLIDNGFEPQESETYICGQISIELEGENENETTLPKETN